MVLVVVFPVECLAPWPWARGQEKNCELKISKSQFCPSLSPPPPFFAFSLFPAAD